MKTNRILAVGIVLAGILLALTTAPRVLAQEQDQNQYQVQAQVPAQDQNQSPAQDPPSRVARLHQAIGSVSFQPGGEGDWVQAVPNRPLTTGDNIWADKDSRAELQMGSTSVRIDSETSLTFLELDDHTTQLRLSQGALIVRIRHLDDEDHFEVDTPNSALVIERPGEYRVDVNSAGDEANVTVWQGRGVVTGGGSSYEVVAGQRASFMGTNQLDHEIGQVPDRDDFDQWAFGRDDHEDRTESSNYISPEMTGAEDLDEYGHWSYVADYGPVWTPMGVAPGWAPYRFGHWVWVEPWGWTWVEDEPWGFAPFHYGRWAFVESGWCWVPGPIMVRPVYAPALVAFVGGGVGVSFGFGAGVAWFPLAPREVFVPWYRTSPVYVNQVNVTNTRVSVTQVTNVYNTTIINNRTTNNITYANQRVPSGVTAVSRETFVNARPVGNNLAKVDPKIAEAPVTHSIPVQPVRASVLGAGRPVEVRPPAAVINRPVVATRTPTLPRTSFEQRHPAVTVRTETPHTPEPARTESVPNRPTTSTRPEEPRNPARPESVTRPEPARTEQPGRQPEAVRPQERPAVPHPPVVENAHPLVRQAPPVQQRPEQQRAEEQKFNNWQQHYTPPSKQAPRPAERAPQPPKPHK